MAHSSRRTFLKTTSSAALAASVAPAFAAADTQRVFVGSNTANGILAYDWNGTTGELKAAGVAAQVPTVDWLAYSPGHWYLFAACEVDSFNGKPTGEVASFRVRNGEIHPLSAQNSAAKGTCHVAVDRTGRVLLSADYGGGAAASFLITEGKLSPAIWTEHYTVHGPDKDRQEAAHAHFCSFSPDSRFAYINDLGGDMIHIYRLDTPTAMLTKAGAYHARPGSGPRTLHFHPNGHTAYCMNEMASSVDVLEWHRADGSLTRVTTVELLPPNPPPGVVSTGCDTVITRDGRFVYFANRGDDFLYAFKADAKTGALTPMKRSNCGGKTPRNFVLDPTESWMLVANQNSNWISVFARNPQTGELANDGKNFNAATPMRILFP
ncbi:MAG TPA: lactonase family protein [Terracidiphilus sp.]|nr:lactonase family protein [Terracidiphilus sp.]